MILNKESVAHNKINFNTILNILFIVYAFLIPTLKYTNKTVAVLMLIIWLLEGEFKHKLKLIISSNIIKIFFLFLAYNYISLFWTTQYNIVLHYLEVYWLYLPMIFIYTSIKKEYIKYAIFAFLAGMFISEIITYGIYFDIWTTPYNDTHFIGIPTAFMSHLAYSIFLAFTAFIILNKFSFHNSIFFNISLFIYLLFVFVNLLISGGRTGLLSFSIALLLYLIVFSKEKIKIVFLSTIGAMLLSFISYSNISIFKDRIDKGKVDISQIINGNYTGSFGQRVGLAIVGIEVFKEKPIFGWGIKDNFEAIKQITKKEEFEYLSHVYNVMNSHFHNQYLIYATQLGIVGVVIFLLLFYYLSKLKIVNEELKKIKFVFIIIFMIGLISTEFFHQMHTIGLFALFSGLFLAQNRYETYIDN